MREEVPISYDKEMIPTQKITLPNFIRCDVKGLDTKVGQITNYSTSMLAMLPLFEGEGKEEQKKDKHFGEIRIFGKKKEKKGFFGKKKNHTEEASTESSNQIDLDAKTEEKE